MGINIGDIYVYYSDADFSVYRIHRIEAIKGNRNRIYLKTMFCDFGLDDNMIDFVIPVGGKLNYVEPANECRNKHGVIIRLLK